MLPNMSQVIQCFSQPIILKEKTSRTVDPISFDDIVTLTSKQINAVVQVQNPESLRIENVDYSLRYIQVHSIEKIAIDDFIEYNGINFKIIIQSNYNDYGYFETVGEEVKGTIR